MFIPCLGLLFTAFDLDGTTALRPIDQSNNWPSTEGYAQLRPFFVEGSLGGVGAGIA